jgi:UDP-glucose 4-epimerase
MARRPAWWLTVLAKIWPITWISAKATTWPVLGPLIAKISLPLFSGTNLNISYIPINEKGDPGKTSLLPVQVVEALINRSSHHAIIKRCTCRDARQCEEHPIQLGCLFLGEGAKAIDARIAYHVSADKAVDHLQKAVNDGLVPMVGRVKIDNYIWGVPDHGKLVTICFCCHCCCTILTSLKYFPKEASDSLVPLDGLHIETDVDLCDGCGICVDACPAEALRMDDTKVQHDSEKCKSCGRCISMCPKNAVSVWVEDIDDAVDALSERIKPMADLG